MKKILTINLLFFLLISCGFAPIYSANKKVNFYIEDIQFNNSDREMANFIKSNLNNYFIKNNGKKFIIESSIDYKKNSISKNSSGKTEEYELSSILTLIVTHNELSKSYQIKETLRMKNFSDEFKEIQFERNSKKNMARSITSRLLMQLSLFDVN